MEQQPSSRAGATSPRQSALRAGFVRGRQKCRAESQCAFQPAESTETLVPEQPDPQGAKHWFQMANNGGQQIAACHKRDATNGGWHVIRLIKDIRQPNPGQANRRYIRSMNTEIPAARQCTA